MESILLSRQARSRMNSEESNSMLKSIITYKNGSKSLKHSKDSMASNDIYIIWIKHIIWLWIIVNQYIRNQQSEHTHHWTINMHPRLLANSKLPVEAILIILKKQLKISLVSYLFIAFIVLV
jgi:hypothetical protein